MDAVAITAGLRRLPEESRSALGTAHNAYTNFFDTWVGELETITGGLLELTDRMHATARTYHDVDRAEEYRFSSGLLHGFSPSPDPGWWNPFR